ncbi:hypothetical protein [Kibdelosporangium philippinense]|uniref:hypothetical protein n=1 Tax=Kibdelosporangium philippinense TaxID=211113 RepID=UPI00361E6217
MAVLNPNYALAGTVNKSGGTPVSSDDRSCSSPPPQPTRAQAERTSQAAQGYFQGRSLLSSASVAPDSCSVNGPMCKTTSDSRALS